MSWIHDDRWSDLIGADVWRDIDAGITVVIADHDEETEE